MAEKSLPKISIIVPLYNEEAIFKLLIDRLTILMNNFNESIEVVLIDDGSKDNTAQLMEEIGLSDERYQCVFLARNYGHQIALSAGLASASGKEAIMIIDGDLQDPPEMLIAFYEKFKQGFDVVYGIRKKRKEYLLKKISYFTFYRLLKKISYIDIPLDAGDFSLISRRVVNYINAMPEESRYIRGMRTWVGFKQIGIEYERNERVAGESKYNFKELFKLAYNGIFNFSEIPIRLITKLGMFSIILSSIYFISVLYKRIFHDDVPIGFTALLFSIILFGGVQLVSIGVIGEYLLRIFFQVKNRPLFIVSHKVKNKETQTLDS
jgi:polyisoprenyl-phosphate glycosyltransferase